MELIYEYLNMTPDITLKTGDKLVSIDNHVPDGAGLNTYAPLKIAVHLHVFYVDIFRNYIAYFDKFKFSFDLFITTDTRDKKEEIEQYLKSFKTWEALKEIIITDNLGRDIIPWISISGNLKDYDVAGHFHTRKSPREDNWTGVVWQQDIFETLLENAGQIMDCFYTDKSLGIVIPDIPRYFSYIAPLDYKFKAILKKDIQKLWRRMNCKKALAPADSLIFIMPVGTMFWYRPAL